LQKTSELEIEMPNPFVWFDNLGTARPETATFLEEMFGWQQHDIGPMTMQIDGDNGPFSGVCTETLGVTGWVPYVEVSDLGAQAVKATSAGAEIIAADLHGPAGTATFIRDPGGAVLALWKRGDTA
jgi:predicted enzyme related to lactoylglutathione lyase